MKKTSSKTTKKKQDVSTLLHDIIIKECTLIPSLTVSKQTPVSEVAKLLAAKNAKQVIVLENNKPVGIITLTDIVYKIVAPQKVLTTTAWDICTRELFYINNTEPLSKAYMYMIANNHLVCPVVAGGTFAGLLSFGAITAKLRENGTRKNK